ncbi:hypothetical protein DPEC_G00300820 [Dallia pectoralis]|uniref:Uncharacterized protein n=1 Tax=Dallia pectoralis TaxID=75939 RepID=A0ACC2FGI8_DALPE|nr:hypothetical protein DPEC_G00300820 [Dallia pectoralis]
MPVARLEKEKPSVVLLRAPVDNGSQRVGESVARASAHQGLGVAMVTSPLHITDKHAESNDKEEKPGQQNGISELERETYPINQTGSAFGVTAEPRIRNNCLTRLQEKGLLSTEGTAVPSALFVPDRSLSPREYGQGKVLVANSNHMASVPPSTTTKKQDRNTVVFDKDRTVPSSTPLATFPSLSGQNIGRVNDINTESILLGMQDTLQSPLNQADKIITSGSHTTDPIGTSPLATTKPSIKSPSSPTIFRSAWRTTSAVEVTPASRTLSKNVRSLVSASSTSGNPPAQPSDRLKKQMSVGVSPEGYRSQHPSVSTMTTLLEKMETRTAKTVVMPATVKSSAKVIAPWPTTKLNIVRSSTTLVSDTTSRLHPYVPAPLTKTTAVSQMSATERSAQERQSVSRGDARLSDNTAGILTDSTGNLKTPTSPSRHQTAVDSSELITKHFLKLKDTKGHVSELSRAQGSPGEATEVTNRERSAVQHGTPKTTERPTRDQQHTHVNAMSFPHLLIKHLGATARSNNYRAENLSESLDGENRSFSSQVLSLKMPGGTVTTASQMLSQIISFEKKTQNGSEFSTLRVMHTKYASTVPVSDRKHPVRPLTSTTLGSSARLSMPVGKWVRHGQPLTPLFTTTTDSPTSDITKGLNVSHRASDTPPEGLSDSFTDSEEKGDRRSDASHASPGNELISPSEALLVHELKSEQSGLSTRPAPFAADISAGTRRNNLNHSEPDETMALKTREIVLSDASLQKTTDMIRNKQHLSGASPEPMFSQKLLSSESKATPLAAHKGAGLPSPDLLTGLAVISDDICGSGNYTAEMNLNLGHDLLPGDFVSALGILHVVINLKTNNSQVNLDLKSCCLSPTGQLDELNTTCCVFSRLPLEPQGIRLLPSALSKRASFTIGLFQMINYSMAYLHCHLSVCLRNHAACERAPEAIVPRLGNRVSFGPVLKKDENSSLPEEMDTAAEMETLLVVLGTVVGCSLVAGTLLLLWTAYRRRRADWSVYPESIECCGCLRRGDQIIP